MPRPAVIAATDRTHRSAHVIDRAAAMAGMLDARLILAHVEATPPAAGPQGEMPATVRKRPLGGLGRKLKKAITTAEPLQTLEALESHLHHVQPDAQIQQLRGDDVAGELAALAGREGAALVVLGLHRKRRVLDALRLTTMERIVQRLSAPVLVAVKPPQGAYRSVLALTDFSPGSAAALAMAARLAPDARFHALHGLALPLGARFSRDDPACDAAITQAEQARDGFLATPGLPGLAEPPLMVPGNLHDLLGLRCGELGADLLCVGLNSGRDGYRLGHYARDLMRAPPIDLLIGRAD